jgi:hypothetical protein
LPLRCEHAKNHLLNVSETLTKEWVQARRLNRREIKNCDDSYMAKINQVSADYQRQSQVQSQQAAQSNSDYFARKSK